MKKLKLGIGVIVGLCICAFVGVLMIPTATPSETSPTEEIAVAENTVIPPTTAPKEVHTPWDKLQPAFEILGFSFSPSDSVNGMPALKGMSPDGFAQLYLIGDSIATYVIDLETLSDEEMELRALDSSTLLLTIDSTNWETAFDWFILQTQTAGNSTSDEYSNEIVINGIRYQFLYDLSLSVLFFTVSAPSE